MGQASVVPAAWMVPEHRPSGAEGTLPDRRWCRHGLDLHQGVHQLGRRPRRHAGPRP